MRLSVGDKPPCGVTACGANIFTAAGSILTTEFCQIEHSGKMQRAWFKLGLWIFLNFELLSSSASFLCAALMSPQSTLNYETVLCGD